MAEINLLKNSAPTRNNWQLISGLLIKVLAVLALAVIGYYVFLYFQVSSATKQITDTQASIAKSKSDALSIPGREEFLIRQTQLKEFITLSSGHLYYSKFLPALAKVTLKNAFYNSITVGTQGKVTLQVIVPTLQDLDKFLQVFDQPEVSKNFYNVRLAGFSKTETDQGQVYNFSVQLDYNSGLLANAPDSN